MSWKVELHGQRSKIFNLPVKVTGGRAKRNQKLDQSRTPAPPLTTPIILMPNPRFWEWGIATCLCQPSGLRSSTSSRPSGLQYCARRSSASCIFDLLHLRPSLRRTSGTIKLPVALNFCALNLRVRPSGIWPASFQSNGWIPFRVCTQRFCKNATAVFDGALFFVLPRQKKKCKDFFSFPVFGSKNCFKNCSDIFPKFAVCEQTLRLDLHIQFLMQLFVHFLFSQTQ